MNGLDIAGIRQQFPALERRIAGRPVAFLDGPAGSQVPRRVIEASCRYLEGSNANTGGAFVTSMETDELLARAHRAAADFVGARDAGEIVFGANMTTLTYGLARSLGRTWRPGDEVVVTRLDHDANVAPWVQAAGEHGVTVHHVGIRREDCTLDLDELAGRLGPRTRLVAVGCASNAVGTISPVQRITELARAAGALVFLDAVHLAPHGRLDVATWGCDFLACSAYKFFGPHVGILWGRRRWLETLPAYQVRAAPGELPVRWETGTLNHEGLAGTLEAIEYLADLGRARATGPLERPAALDAAFAAISAHERRVMQLALEKLGALAAVTLWGIRDPARLAERTPTFAFTHRARRPREIVAELARSGIFAWSGNFFALPVTEALGLEPDGLVRVGFLHYNTEQEVERLARELERLG